MSCPRSITFTIPGKLGVGVQITAVENGGNLDFTVEVVGSSMHTADLRGLFFQFNEADLSGLHILGGDGLITGSQIQANSVINLGQGVNMNGAASPFDVGIAFGTPGKGQDLINGPVHFTLDATQNLTLDDIAHLQFGARLTSVGDKITAFAPAAPDAHDDAATTHEDVPVTIDVLANDTDADGNPLTITDAEGAQHGTLAIVNNKVVYTPTQDFAGLNTDPASVDDSFTYCISDGHGGQDSATVNLHVIPVADPPHVSIQVLAPHAGDPVNEVRLHVTATTTDIDGSELISLINFGALPAGVTLTPGTVVHSLVGGLDSASEDVQLLLPTDHSTNFDLGVTAVSDENGNGDPDTASTTQTQHIELDASHNAAHEIFQATNQSIWEEGNAFVKDENDFLGVDIHPSAEVDFLVGSAGGDVHLKTGFQSTLHITLGDIDATLPFDINLDDLYNKTTDTLQITPSEALAPGGSFSTEGPGGFYNLGFIFGAEASAHADAFGIGGSVDTGVIGSFTDPLFNIVHLDSADAHLDVPIPPGDPVATLSFNWPTVNTTSAPSATSMISSDPATEQSPDIVHLDLDALAIVFAALGIPNPFDLDFVNLLSVHVNGGIDVTQHFDLSALGLNATLNFEDGSSQLFDFSSPLTINNASSHDANHDGNIAFDLALTPDATLHNDTGLGFHVGFDIKVLDFPDPIGALVDIPASFPLGDIGLYDKTFARAA